MDVERDQTTVCFRSRGWGLWFASNEQFHTHAVDLQALKRFFQERAFITTKIGISDN